MIALLLAAFVSGPVVLGSHVGDYRSGGAGGVSATGSVITGTGTCVGTNSVLRDSAGTVGCQKLSDTAPLGLLIKPQSAYALGTQSAAHLILAGGADEQKITIATYTNCSTDTVTVSVASGSLGTTTTSVLTEGTNWTAATSNAATATSLAAAIDALAGVSATAASGVVSVNTDSGAAAVTLATSDATCDTVANGTGGGVRIFTPGLTASNNGIEIISTSATGNIIRNLYDSSSNMCIGHNPASSAAGSSVCSTSGGLAIYDSAGGYSLITAVGTPISLTSGQASTATTYGFRFNPSNGFTATSGTQAAVGIIGTINQASGTASTNMLSIDATTTAVGSGAQNAIRVTDDTVEKATISLSGIGTFVGGLITPVLEADLTAGACTAGTWKVDNQTTRELCRCNDAGTAYDCISVTTTNGPTN